MTEEVAIYNIWAFDGEDIRIVSTREQSYAVALLDASYRTRKTGAEHVVTLKNSSYDKALQDEKTRKAKNMENIGYQFIIPLDGPKFMRTVFTNDWTTGYYLNNLQQNVPIRFIAIARNIQKPKGIGKDELSSYWEEVSPEMTTASSEATSA